MGFRGGGGRNSRCKFSILRAAAGPEKEKEKWWHIKPSTAWKKSTAHVQQMTNSGKQKKVVQNTTLPCGVFFSPSSPPPSFHSSILGPPLIEQRQQKKTPLLINFFVLGIFSPLALCEGRETVITTTLVFCWPVRPPSLPPLQGRIWKQKAG